MWANSSNNELSSGFSNLSFVFLHVNCKQSPSGYSQYVLYGL